MSSTIKSQYRIFNESTPYFRKDRYENPKEVFKGIWKKTQECVNCGERKSAVDIGCANGEYLYYLKQQCPQWDYTGYDMTEGFIETARSIEQMKDIRFEVKNLFDIEGEPFDVVYCLGTFPIFHGVDKPLQKLLNICKPNGFIFVEGFFNKYDIDVRLEFCDNSREEMRGQWRSDYNQHSCYSVRKFLDGKVRKFEFNELPVEVDIPYDPEKPATFAFTFRDADGKNIVTSGLNMFRNTTLLSIQK